MFAPTRGQTRGIVILATRKIGEFKMNAELLNETEINCKSMLDIF